ncbi:Uncharacterised protein [Bordetella pertussis]|nr:Uncharacterised protein [Bordetella pertussis]
MACRKRALAAGLSMHSAARRAASASSSARISNSSSISAFE